MAKLYELSGKINTFEFEVDEETGEILNGAELESLEMQREEKIENIGLFIKNLESDIVAYKHEKDLFAKKIERANAKIDWLKQYLSEFVGMDGFETARVRISYRESKAVNILDESEIPDEFFRVKREVNKAEISKRLKNEEEIPGVQLVVRNNIQVK